MRWLAVACVLSLLGCDQLDAALPVLERSTPSVQLAKGAPMHLLRKGRERDAAAERRELEGQIRELRQRLSFSGASIGSGLSACKDLRLGQLLTQKLPIAVVDARATTRSLIPRRVTERLESPEIAMLREASDAAESASDESMEPFSAAVRELATHRYVGVFYVTDYTGPALILRVGEIRRSWYAGTLAASFALFDTETQKPACGQLISVQNDVKEAPIRSRLQSETRSKLERELSDAALAEALDLLRQDYPQVAFSLRFSEGSK